MFKIENKVSGFFVKVVCILLNLSEQFKNLFSLQNVLLNIFDQTASLFCDLFW